MQVEWTKTEMEMEIIQIEVAPTWPDGWGRMAWWEQTSDCQEDSSPTTNLDLAHRYAMFLCSLDVEI